MSDPADEAAEAEEKFRERALQQARGSLGAPGDWDRLSAKWCKGARCGERIPDERRRAIPGVELCTDCQVAKEKRERQGR